MPETNGTTADGQSDGPTQAPAPPSSARPSGTGPNRSGGSGTRTDGSTGGARPAKGSSGGGTTRKDSAGTGSTGDDPQRKATTGGDPKGDGGSRSGRDPNGVRGKAKDVAPTAPVGGEDRLDPAAESPSATQDGRVLTGTGTGPAPEGVEVTGPVLVLGRVSESIVAGEGLSPELPRGACIAWRLGRSHPREQAVLIAPPGYEETLDVLCRDLLIRTR